VRTVILVPRRAGFEERDRLWKWCKAWWLEHFPEYPIFEGHHDHGLFNRSAAINEAARKAGEWDVALIIDADVIPDTERQVHQAAHTAFETGRLTVAFTLRHDLSRLSTEKLLNGHDKDDWSTGIDHTYLEQHSSIIAVSRTLWDEVGGFDEGFRGHGMEDTAFALACDTIGGPRDSLPGIVWHLWHQRAPEAKVNSPSRTANRHRVARYKEAWGDKARMREILSESGSPEAEMAIPPILHRVVPEKTSAAVERWWQEFQAFHPGWRTMTWRDPLDPKDFPITAPYWKKAVSGAQFADLIRLEVLWNWGGFYVDSDMQPFRSLVPLLNNQVVAAYEDDRSVPNAFIGARRQHPAIEACLDAILERFDADHMDIWACGPGVTTDIFTNRDDVLLLPPESVYPTHYKDPLRDRKMRDFAPAEHPWTYMQHWYAGSWLEDPRRRKVLE